MTFRKAFSMSIRPFEKEDNFCVLVALYLHSSSILQFVWFCLKSWLFNLTIVKEYSLQELASGRGKNSLRGRAQWAFFISHSFRLWFPSLLWYFSSEIIYFKNILSRLRSEWNGKYSCSILNGFVVVVNNRCTQTTTMFFSLLNLAILQHCSLFSLSIHYYYCLQNSNLFFSREWRCQEYSHPRGEWAEKEQENEWVSRKLRGN